MSPTDKAIFRRHARFGWDPNSLGELEDVPVAGMPDRNRAVDVRRLDSRSAASQLPVQVMAHPLMVTHLQAEIIADRAMPGGGF